MNSYNISIGHLFGIPILVHKTTLWLLVAIAVLKGPVVALGMVIVLTIVLLHELGHSVAAQRLKIQVLKITIYPFGGMAQMAISSENSRHELLVALAGPMVNFALALPGLAFLLATGSLDTGTDEMSLGVYAVAAWTVVNLMLGFFNLIPAFPMDGGRVLRALLVPKLGHLQATELAVRVGRWIAALMVAYSIFGSGPRFGLFFVAILVWAMGGRELFAVRMRHAASGQGQDPRDILSQMFKQASKSSFQGAQPGPQAEPQSQRQPGAIDIIVDDAGASKHGFSQSDIQRLEGFHGRLPKDADE